MPLFAEETTTTETEVSENADGSVTKTETTTTTFDDTSRVKVVKYFDAFKTNPHGLPPSWVAKMKVKELPAAWRTTVAPGMIITESDRVMLIDAPPELIEVLPEAPADVRYFMAGSNVIAVDKEFKIVDSIQIPTVHFVVE